MASDLATDLLGPAHAAERTARAAPQWWARFGEPVSFVIIGEPASKANSRQIVMLGKGPRRRPAVIKSAKARAYERTAALQIPKLPALLQGPLAVTIRIWYASERCDLDESIVLDAMQMRIYRNDRQVREKHIFHAIDRANPRAEITVQPLVAQQAPLF